MAEKHTIKLKHPVTVAGETIEQLELRRPKGRELRELGDGKGGATKRTYELLANLSQTSLEVFDELDAEDIATVQDWLLPILDPQKGGES